MRCIKQVVIAINNEQEKNAHKTKNAEAVPVKNLA